MSKAFTRESDFELESRPLPRRPLSARENNPITAAGAQRFEAELVQLIERRRGTDLSAPETVSLQTRVTRLRGYILSTNADTIRLQVTELLFLQGPPLRVASPRHDVPLQPQFAIGATVRVRNMHPPGHTRLPRYVRGHVGTIERVRGCHVFPDSNASGAGENPQWLYSVCFEGRELWGADGDPTAKVSVDAWEPYLEPA